MMTLPVDPVAAAASEFACSEVESIRDEPIPIFGMDLLWFDKGDNRRLGREVIKACAIAHPTRMMTVVDWARQGWGLAEEALRHLIVEYMDRGQQLPTYLAAYNMELIAGPRPKIRGQQKADNFLRDIAITVIVQRVVEQYNVHPTGRSARHRSACAIVADALARTRGVTGMSEKGVAEIWRKYGQI